MFLEPSVTAGHRIQKQGQQVLVSGGGLAGIQAAAQLPVTVSSAFDSSPAEMLVNALTGNSVSNPLAFPPSVGAEQTVGNTSTTTADVGSLIPLEQSPGGSTRSANSAIMEWINQQTAANQNQAGARAPTAVVSMPQTPPTSAGGGLVLQPIMIPGLNSVILPYLQLSNSNQVKAEPNPAGANQVVVVSSYKNDA